MTEEMEEKQVNEIRVFNSDQFGEVRTVTIDDEPWFVAADVCRALEIGNSRMATDRLDDDEKAAVSLTDTSSNGVTQQREMTVINEPGLYSLVLGSRKPEARAFKRWITHEVIPALRKTGTYSLKPMSQLEIAKISLDMLIEQEKRLDSLEQENESTREQIKELNAKIATRVQDSYSVAGYASLRGIKLDVSRANMLGREATRLSQKYGYEISKTPDPRFGTVNVYHTDVLKAVFEDL